METPKFLNVLYIFGMCIIEVFFPLAVPIVQVEDPSKSSP